MVKGVADFPNTIYLLSFDRDVVVDAIADKSGGLENGQNNAEKYLGKIIQMSLDLPPANKLLLHDYFCKQLKCILETSSSHWHANYWRSLFGAVSRFLKTPRDAKRVT